MIAHVPTTRAPEAVGAVRSSPHDGGTLCFFGVGALLEDCFDQLVLAAGRRPDVLSDNAADKWGESRFGIPCVAPERIPGTPERTTIVVCIRNFEACSRQLQALGYRHIHIASFDRGYHRVCRLSPLRDYANDAGTPGAIARQGQWALVTGATRGIGRRIAEALLSHGMNLVCHGRTPARVETACAKLATTGCEIVPFVADLAQTGDVDRLCNWLSSDAPPLSVLYNNAGISPACVGGFWKMGSDELAACYAVNAIAPIRICQAIIPAMQCRSGGRIVNVSSSIQYRPDEMAYACSKAALDKFVHDLAPHLRGSGVMMSTLDPGWLRTDMGGTGAPHPVTSVLPGALIGALIDGDVNGCSISAQDYVGLSLAAAMQKAFFIGACKPPTTTGK